MKLSVDGLLVLVGCICGWFVWMDGWIDGWMDGWMCGWIDVWLVGWLDVCMYGWMCARFPLVCSEW